MCLNVPYEHATLKALEILASVFWREFRNTSDYEAIIKHQVFQALDIRGDEGIWCRGALELVLVDAVLFRQAVGGDCWDRLKADKAQLFHTVLTVVTHMHATARPGRQLRSGSRMSEQEATGKRHRRGLILHR